jgi:glutamate/tyrosine decarboxylase-like PLP-dependent enzyme
MLARLFNAPLNKEESNIMGTSTIGSSEVRNDKPVVV